VPSLCFGEDEPTTTIPTRLVLTLLAEEEVAAEAGAEAQVRRAHRARIESERAAEAAFALPFDEILDALDALGEETAGPPGVPENSNDCPERDGAWPADEPPSGIRTAIKAPADPWTDPRERPTLPAPSGRVACANGGA
jgi:hypothetical protein